MCHYLFQNDPFSGGGIWEVPEIIETLHEELIESLGIEARAGSDPAQPVPDSSDVQESSLDAIEEDEILATEIRDEHGVPPSTLQGWIGGKVKELGALKEKRRTATNVRVFDRAQAKKFIDRRAARKRGKST